jgi:acetyl-CoA carboxylase carboxyltransferase component
MAQTLEIDAVIDPADTRSWLVRGLESGSRGVREATPYVDTW